MTIFFDADIYIAIYNKNDALHQKVVEFSKIIRSQSPRYVAYTSYDVMDEVATKLRYQIGKLQAVRFLDYLINSKTIIVYPNQELIEKSIKIFSQIKNKHVSLTDCSNIAIMRHMNLKYIFSFDKIYQQQGLNSIIQIYS